ncbi:hypothetical protein IMZ29_17380 [Achromobacter sp. GG226]|uniref:hypothetical protein n=1 Tax=Verticiella alkaliphila TaxID=2779529 RepID=UPI001C0E2BD6|nr:hypothetical protein [Verticiella sp. GG226]MBU4612249.1 hypothetical protein [Verticiella sp. GG226]
MGFIVIALIIVIALGAFVWQRDEPKREAALQTSLDAMQGFSPALTLFGADGGTGVALDPNARAVGLLQPNRPATRVEASRVLGADLYQDGQRIGTVTRDGAQARLATLRERQPAPAAPPSPRGEQVPMDTVHRVELRLWIDNDTNPTHDVRLLDREVRNTDAAFKEAVAAGEGWLAQLSALLR